MTRVMLFMLMACSLGATAALSAEPKLGAATNAPVLPRPKPEAVLQLWPGEAPGLAAVARPETIVNERFVNISVPQLYVYLPPRAKANGTALLICAGGGYNHLAMGVHVESVVRLLTEQGIAVFGLKYRTHYGNNDVAADALADGKRAVRLVRGRAAEWGVNPGRVGVQGYSAGANLCLNLAGQFDLGMPQSADPLERLSSRPDFVVLMCPWPNKKTIETYVLRQETPPTFIAHARDDRTAPFAFAVAIDEKLKGLGVQERLFAVDRGGHSAFHYGEGTGEGAHWPEALLPWLKKIGML